MKERFGAKHVDMINRAGIVRILAERSDQEALRVIRGELEISLTRHDSGAVAIAAHHQCAGNLVKEARQIKQLRNAKRTILEMIQSFRLKREVQVICLWINGDWMPEEKHSQELVTTS